MLSNLKGTKVSNFYEYFQFIFLYQFWELLGPPSYVLLSGHAGK